MAKAVNETSMPPEIITSNTPSAMMPITTLERRRPKILSSDQNAGLMRPIMTIAANNTQAMMNSVLRKNFMCRFLNSAS